MSPDLPPHPLKVLHLTIALARGGRRDAILTLAQSGVAQGVIPYLATLRGDPEEAEAARASFAEVRNLGILGRPSLRQLRDLRDKCRDWGVQVVHAHDASSQLVASMLRIVAPSLQVVMTFHRSLAFESAGWRNRLRNALTLPLVSRVLTASEERRQHFLSENLVSRAKVRALPLGINLDRFHPDHQSRKDIRDELGMQDHQLLIVAAGHLGPEKGIDLVLESVALALEDLPGLDAHLAIMGTGAPARIELIHDLGRLKLGSRVTFLGQRSDPERILAAADLVVHTPRLEAFGLVVVQAMGCGAPIVASRVGGIPEIVVEGETGLLAPPEDPPATALLIRSLLGSAPQRAALGAAGLARARSEYSAERFAARHRALYQGLIHGE